MINLSAIDTVSDCQQAYCTDISNSDCPTLECKPLKCNFLVCFAFVKFCLDAKSGEGHNINCTTAVHKTTNG